MSSSDLWYSFSYVKKNKIWYSLELAIVLQCSNGIGHFHQFLWWGWFKIPSGILLINYSVQYNHFHWIFEGGGFPNPIGILLLQYSDQYCHFQWILLGGWFQIPFTSFLIILIEFCMEEDSEITSGFSLFDVRINIAIWVDLLCTFSGLFQTHKKCTSLISDWIGNQTLSKKRVKCAQKRTNNAPVWSQTGLAIRLFQKQVKCAQKLTKNAPVWFQTGLVIRLCQKKSQMCTKTHKKCTSLISDWIGNQTFLSKKESNMHKNAQKMHQADSSLIGNPTFSKTSQMCTKTHKKCTSLISDWIGNPTSSKKSQICHQADPGNMVIWLGGFNFNNSMTHNFALLKFKKRICEGHEKFALFTRSINGTWWICEWHENSHYSPGFALLKFKKRICEWWHKNLHYSPGQ